MARIAILTASDKAAAGERSDESGPTIARLAHEAGHDVMRQDIVPDNRALISHNREAPVPDAYATPRGLNVNSPACLLFCQPLGLVKS